MAEVIRPSRASVQVAITLVFAVALTVGLAIAKPAPSQACQRLVIVSSAEKSTMLVDFAASYNQTAGRMATPCVTVAVQQVNSGDAEMALEQGWQGQTSDRPDVWAPASSAWVELLAVADNAQKIKPVANPQSLFKSPLVIGVPKPMADALGWSRKQVGWKDIFALVKQRDAWRARGHPEWGQFRLGKTNPRVSTSGLHALIGAYVAAAGSGFTVEDVNSAPVHDFVAGIESGVVHYAPTATDFLRNLREASRDRGLLYVSAVAIEEQELLDYNAGIIGGEHKGAPAVSLVPIYPTEGTPVADHPYVILNPDRKDAAEHFFRFVRQPSQQSIVEARGFRWVGSTDRGSMGPTLIKRKLDPSQPRVVLQPPNGLVLRAMLDAWQGLRKRARVLILVDAAADADALKQATVRLADAVSRFNATDSAGLWVFPAPATYPTSYVELLPVAPVSGDLNSRLRSIAHTGDARNVALTLKEAVVRMGAAYDPGAIDAVLLVEMSPANNSNQDDLELQQFLLNQPVDHFVRVFTVGPVSDQLREYTLAGGGVSYQPGSASHLLNDVISNF